MAGLFWWLPSLHLGWATPTPDMELSPRWNIQMPDFSGWASSPMLRCMTTHWCTSVSPTPSSRCMHWWHGCTASIGAPAPFWFHLVNTRRYHSNGRSYSCSCSQPWQKRSDSKVQWLFLRPSGWSLTNSPWVLLLIAEIKFVWLIY